MRLFGAVWLLVLCVVLMPQKARSQAATASPTAAQSASSSAAQNASQTQTVEYTLPPDKLAQAKALYDLRGRLRIIGTVYSLLIWVAILYLGIAAAYRNWAERIAGRKFQIFTVALAVLAILLGGVASLRALFPKEPPAGKAVHVALLLLMAWICLRMANRRAWAERFAQGLIFVPLLLLTTRLLELPLDAYHQKISLQYGLSVQSWRSWFGDEAVGFLVGTGISLLALWGITNLILKHPRSWWFRTWLLAIPFVIFIVFIAPIAIDPLFNKFEPLEKSNPQLVEAIEKVTRRGGLEIPRDRMFLMKASEKVTTLNAYVTGFGPSKRVVVWDTTIQKAGTPETLYIYGHEMGHYVLNHVRIGLGLGIAGLFFGLLVLYLAAHWAFPRFRERWRMRGLEDWAAVPMLLLLIALMDIVSQPVGSTISRQLEHNADVYGLEVTHGINPNPQEAAAHAFQVLGELSLSYPNPSRFEVFWYYDHPPIADRVRFAHNYDPWSKGEEPKYVK